MKEIALKPESILIQDADTASQVRRVVETLEEDIAFGYMHPRERLVEDELLERFGLKRHVVRQVLAELEQIGLVERKKNFGAVVKSYSVKEVVDLYIVRDILETNCARQIKFPVPAEKMEQLEVIQKKHDTAVMESNLHVAFRMNLAFHKALFALSDNPALTELIELAAQRTHVIRSLIIVVPQILEQSRQDHHHIINALKTGDQDRLVELCRSHLLPSRDAYIEQHRRLEYSTERAEASTQSENPSKNNNNN
jgi:DNA-binding GntR family transcriptional regulator